MWGYFFLAMAADGGASVAGETRNVRLCPHLSVLLDGKLRVPLFLGT